MSKPTLLEALLTEAEEGEWVEPRKRDYRLACCDCGLVHRVNFRVRSGQVQFQVFRDDALTKRLRKARNL